MVLDRYQSGLGEPGTMPTEDWFRALTDGVEGPLGDVLDVGCAEGVMCVLAAQAGATWVTGIGLHDDRMAAALTATEPYTNIEIREQAASAHDERHDTVVFSMMAHWLGPDETRRFASLARRWFLIVFREANDHYAPENGSWFPTFEELDAVISGVRVHEQLVLEQDHGKRTWAAVYRTDVRVEDGMVWKMVDGKATWTPFRDGFDLHGDRPFRSTHGAPVIRLSGPNAAALRILVRNVASDALQDGTYPSDFSPRNVIVNGDEAWLIEDRPSERVAGTHVTEPWLSIWRSTLSAIGLPFSGDLRELL